MALPPYKAPSRASYDIVIVGGAVVGSSVAYWLSQALGRTASILVVERDSSYAFSSTALSTSAIRQQYSNPINVKISQFGIEIIRSFAERMKPYYKDEPAPDLGFREHGYLYCCSPDGVEAAKARVDLQRSLGAHTVFLDPGPLKERFPWLNVEDLYRENGEYRFQNGWHVNALIAAGIGILFSSILPNFTNLLPAWWGVYGWFFGVAIAGAIYYGLRARDVGAVPKTA